MKLLEITFWNATYWALYLPTSLLVQLLTGEGELLGILIIGLLCTLLLNIFLAFQKEGFFDYLSEPAEIVYTVENSEKKEEPEIVEPILADDSSKQKEVKQDEQEKIEELVEPEPKMRTDVNLSTLDNDTDDELD